MNTEQLTANMNHDQTSLRVFHDRSLYTVQVHSATQACTCTGVLYRRGIGLWDWEEILFLRGT